MNLPRRQFLKSGFAAGLLGNGLLGSLGRQALGANVGDPNKKLLFIFQRGGNDGINTIIPHGDPEYNNTNRPSLYISPTAAIDLRNNFASLHPAMSPMSEIFDAGQLAAIHRVAYQDQSRSHFDSQDYWEKGAPRNPDVKSGMFYRQLEKLVDLNDPSNAFVAAALSGSQMVSLQGEKPIPNFTDSGSFTFLGSEAHQAKFLGANESAPGLGDGKGMLGLYSSTGLSGKVYSQIVGGTGKALGLTLETLSAAQGDYTPANGAIYPPTSFGTLLEEAAMLFKRTPARLLGIDIGGWDTHTNQGAANGTQATRLNYVAQGFQALYRDLQDQWDDLVIITMTEFGRTSKENGSRGTDHAEASAMFVAGGGVKGGVYNCDETSWEVGAMFSERDRYLSRKTDFRAIFGEIFMKHFGDTRPMLDEVIPGYTEAETADPLGMAQLGIMV
jgi:uncharacterized protein (DUF1501 family)